jgi:hypothetical protein
MNTMLESAQALPNAPINKRDMCPQISPHQFQKQLDEDIARNRNYVRIIKQNLAAHNKELLTKQTLLKELQVTTEAAEQKIASDLLASENLIASVHRSFNSFRQAISLIMYSSGSVDSVNCNRRAQIA